MSEKILITYRCAGKKNYTAIPENVLKQTLSCTGSTEFGKKWELTLKNSSSEDFRGVIHAEVCFDAEKPAFFMPDYMYNRNRGNVKPYTNSRGWYHPFPRLSSDPELNGASSYWMVRSDRLSHPVSLAFDNGMIYGITGSPCNQEDCLFNGFSCRLGETSGSVGYTFGYENAPWLYGCAGSPKESSPEMEGAVVIGAGQTKTIVFESIAYASADIMGIHDVIRFIYSKYHQSPRQGSPVKTAVKDIAEAIYHDAYIPDVKNYGTQVYLKDGEITMNPLASISWTGGVEIASPLLLAAARLNNQEIRGQAVEVIQNIVDHSLNPNSGLPFDAYMDGKWTTKGWWSGNLREPGHSSYLVGQALYYIVHAYKTERDFFHTAHGDWLDFIRGALDAAVKTTDAAGEFPHVWSAENGTALDYDSFCGCWCAAAAAYCDKVCGTTRYLAQCEKSLRHYHRTYVKKLECYGTPHDTGKAVDSEGSLSFIKAARYLHELTGKAEYLQMLEDGLQYEFTFKFCWNPPIQAEPLKKLKWTCCGGSVTSTCNPHIHPMSSNVVDELNYCWERTGDPYYEMRLRDTIDWSRQTYSTYDGEYDFGKKGWMSERFCHSQALLVEKYENGDPCSTWKCFLAWGASNILDGLCGIAWQK